MKTDEPGASPKLNQIQKVGLDWPYTSERSKQYSKEGPGQQPPRGSQGDQKVTGWRSMLAQLTKAGTSWQVHHPEDSEVEIHGRCPMLPRAPKKMFQCNFCALAYFCHSWLNQYLQKKIHPPSHPMSHRSCPAYRDAKNHSQVQPFQMNCKSV